MRPTAILAAFATFALSSLPLAAESHDGGNGGCKNRGQARAKLLERFDANQDGTLDMTERDAAKQAHKDHKGKLGAKLLEKHPELDSNGDGALSREEAKAGRQQQREKHEAAFKEKHPKAFAKLDGNGDGAIDQSERQAGRAQFLAKHPEADANGDGKLGRCERKDFRREHGQDNKGDNGRRAHGDPSGDGHDHGRRGKNGK